MAHVQDAALLPADMPEALKSGDFDHVRMMIGNTAHEGVFYVTQSERMMGRPLTEAACQPARRTPSARRRGQ